MRGGDGGESGGVNGVEMSCRMMGHYFWHCSSEPLVFRSAANLQSRLLQGPQAKGVRGMKLTRLTESVNLPTKKQNHSMHIYGISHHKLKFNVYLFGKESHSSNYTRRRRRKSLILIIPMTANSPQSGSSGFIDTSAF